MKTIWLNSLLRTYAVAMMIIMAFTACLIAYSSWQIKYNEAERAVQQLSLQLLDEVEYYYQRSSQVGHALVANDIQIEGIYKYFSLTPAQYATWLSDVEAPKGVQPSFHRNIESAYLQNGFITSLDIALQDYKTVFISTHTMKGGRQVSSEDFKPNPAAFPVPVYDNVSDQFLGIVYVSIDSAIFRQKMINIAGDIPMMVRIESPYEQEMLRLSDIGDAEIGPWLTRETQHGYQVSIALPKHYLLKQNLLQTVLILGMSFSLSGLLYLLLRRVFHTYQIQVTDLVETMQMVAAGDSHKRIEVDTKERELFLIAQTTNQMLDNLDCNLRDIYQLQLSQKDANLRALQAQINPHFLYNTLEFIRMYAVMQNQDELADIIYEFSSLLRNNTSDEQSTSLEKELEFCRKYSYLCMMRYPKSVAYDVKIDPAIAQLRIPKFSIQPLVENYFAHGIDHSRYNNAISIKAQEKEDGVEILIRDNGKGMDGATLEKIQEILAQRQFHHQEQEGRQSIGIANVHERLVLHFGERYSIQLESELGYGVTYRIFIRHIA